MASRAPNDWRPQRRPSLGFPSAETFAPNARLAIQLGPIYHAAMNFADHLPSIHPAKAYAAEPRLHVAVGILARNEETRIPQLLAQLARQTFLRTAKVDIHVVPNACTDATNRVSLEALSAFPSGLARKTEVHETSVGGKSRNWNFFVHSLSDQGCDLIMMMDADIELADDGVLADLVATLVATPTAAVCTGRPIKSIALKARKSFLDKFSLAVSEQALAHPSINGSLYVAWADELRTFWLPEPTPGEDGFLNAVVKTRGFTSEEASRVCRIARVSHFYDGVRVSHYFRHQKRMILGTAVNFWLFEYIRAHPEERPVGEMIKYKNRQQPGWVGKIVKSKTMNKRWVVPRRVLLWHFDDVAFPISIKSAVKFATATIAATLNLVACVLANRSLQREGSESYW